MELLRKGLDYHILLNKPIVGMLFLLTVLIIIIFYKNVWNRNVKISKFAIVLLSLQVVINMSLLVVYLYNDIVYTNPINEKSVVLTKDKRFVNFGMGNEGLLKPKVDVYPVLYKEFEKSYEKDELQEETYEPLYDMRSHYYLEGKNLEQDKIIATKGSNNKYYISIAMKDTDKRLIYKTPIKMGNGVILDGYIGTKIDKEGTGKNVIRYRYNKEYDVFYDIEMTMS